MLQFQGVPAISAMIQHHTPTSSPNDPRSNRFVERMVGVAKKLMDKAGREGKPRILINSHTQHLYDVQIYIFY